MRLRKLLIAYMWMILQVILFNVSLLNAERPTIIDTIYTENSLQAGLNYKVEMNIYSGGGYNELYECFKA